MVCLCGFHDRSSLDSTLGQISSPFLRSSRRQPEEVEVVDENDEHFFEVGDDLEGSEVEGPEWAAIFDGEDEEYLRAGSCFVDSSVASSENETPLIRPPLSKFDFYSQPSTSDVINSFYNESSYATTTEAKEALSGLVGSKFCFGGSVAHEDMDIFESRIHNALVYSLETFTESRSIYWDKSPHTDETVDENLPMRSIPDTWNIHCHPTRMFRDETKQLEMPETAFVSECQSCSSSGWGKCRCCVSRGHIRCVNCSGTGRLNRVDTHDHRHLHTCWHCHGTGRKKCSNCEGKGKNFCSICQGRKKVKFVSKLKIEYKNLRSDHAILPINFPENLIMEALGDFIIDEVQPRVRHCASDALDGHVKWFIYGARR